MAAHYVSKKITRIMSIVAGVIYLLVFGISALAFWLVLSIYGECSAYTCL